jgi:hypothetical protein
MSYQPSENYRIIGDLHTVALVLPASRSVQVGATATVFATMIASDETSTARGPSAKTARPGSGHVERPGCGHPGSPRDHPMRARASASGAAAWTAAPADRIPTLRGVLASFTRLWLGSGFHKRGQGPQREIRAAAGGQISLGLGVGGAA